MEELLASQPQKSLMLSRGQEVEGQVVLITGKEIILDFGTKSEGVIQSRELSADQLKNLKPGDKLKAYVVTTENESGQMVLSLNYSAVRPTKGRGIDWARFTALQNHQSKLQGKVVEVNKGGLMIETDSTRGFLPNSQVGFELLSKSGGMGELIGQSLSVTVIEVDQNNNKLIFSQRGQVLDQVLEALKGFKKGQQVSGKIVAILPFGLVIDLNPSGGLGTGGIEGLVFISDVSWEKVEDLSSLYTLGQTVETQVVGVDEDLGRVNLSIKHLTEDPFTKLAQKYPADEVVKGQIMEVTTAGVVVKMENGAEGFLPASKMDPDQSYQVGKSVTLLVDSVDTQRRRINLAPFITSTAGLIYK